MNLLIPLKIRYIIYTALALLGLSFLAFFYNYVNIAGFIGFGLFCLILGLWKREFALYLAFLELCLGSFGYLLTLSAGGLNLPLRILFFLIIMSLWLLDLRFKIKDLSFGIVSLRDRLLNNYKRNPILFSLAIFLVVWVFGILHGYFRGHLTSNIFFDANSYIYLLLILPALTYINTQEKLKQLIKIILVGSVIMAVQTFALFITFIKLKKIGFLEILYKWTRDFRIGEVTSLKNGTYRIFIQSQFYLIVGFLLLIVRYFYSRIKWIKFLALAALLSGAIYISLSRSFWVGTTAGLLVFLGLLIYLKSDNRKMVKTGASIVLAAFIGIFVAGLFAPKDASFSSIVRKRIKMGESALNTRVEQLKPLIPAIKRSPVFGYGFGKTLTFKSFDPRVTTVLKTGEYTTYAFEWGYLDIILKVGILGLLVYLYFIWNIVFGLFKKLKTDWRCIWALSILAALLATHIFTPYLNHPLGIGVLILGGVIANCRKN